MTAWGQACRFELLTITSGLPRTSDVSGPGRHFGFGPKATCQIPAQSWAQPGRARRAYAHDSRVACLYLARFQVTVPTPPLDAVAVMYLSSSLPAVTIDRFCSVPFQFGNVALSTLKVSVLSVGLSE